MNTNAISAQFILSNIRGLVVVLQSKKASSSDDPTSCPTESNYADKVHSNGLSNSHVLTPIKSLILWQYLIKREVPMIQRLSHPTEINKVGKESSSKCQPKRSRCKNPVVNPKGCILYPK